METVVVGLDVPPARVEPLRWAADYCRLADQVGASVIVVGRKGASRLRGVLLGRVPAQLPYHANRPVAIVPRRAAD